METVVNRRRVICPAGRCLLVFRDAAVVAARHDAHRLCVTFSAADVAPDMYGQEAQLRLFCDPAVIRGGLLGRIVELFRGRLLRESEEVVIHALDPDGPIPERLMRHLRNLRAWVNVRHVVTRTGRIRPIIDLDRPIKPESA